MTVHDHQKLQPRTTAGQFDSDISPFGKGVRAAHPQEILGLGQRGTNGVELNGIPNHHRVVTQVSEVSTLKVGLGNDTIGVRDRVAAQVAKFSVGSAIVALPMCVLDISIGR